MRRAADGVADVGRAESVALKDLYVVAGALVGGVLGASLPEGAARGRGR